MMMEGTLSKPILLFNDECAVCRAIARWVMRSAQCKVGGPSITVRPIGSDPLVLRTLNPDLDIWDAYANIHLLMPDGSMRINGEAVAETLRNLPATRWLAGGFNLRIFGQRPLQAILNAAYTVLADIRPLLGCESCGIPPLWLRPFHWISKRIEAMFKARKHTSAATDLTTRPPSQSSRRSNSL